MDLDYNMDLRNVHSYMFDRMDNHRRYNNQLVKRKLDVLELKRANKKYLWNIYENSKREVEMNKKYTYLASTRCVDFQCIQVGMSTHHDVIVIDTER